MKKSGFNLHPLFVAIASRTVIGSALVAVTVPAVAAVASESGMMTEEVVVTARRKDENLAKVPIAVSALGAEQLNDRQVKTDSDLQFAVPGLTIRQTQGNNSLTYSIRGQSADTFSGSPSAVVAYINEVPLTISGASTFYDLQSVQVLKGPQGTLFGRNTTGGAVLYTTAKPTNENEGLLRVRAGNYDLREVEGMINLPLVDDTLLMRAAFNTLDRDGYIENVFPGNNYDHGDIGRDSGRITLTAKPNDRLENTTMYSYSRTDGTNTGATYVYSIYTPFHEAFYSRDLNTSSAFIADAVARQKLLGYYKTEHPYRADHVGEDEVFINTTIFEFSDTLRIKNILGYISADTDSEQPALGASFPTFATRNVATGRAGNEVEVESFSDELQLSGDAFDNRLTYIAGLYYQDMTTDTLWPQTYFGGAVTATNNFRIQTETKAIYAQGSYSLLPELRVTAGLRYTDEDVTISQLSESDAYGAVSQNETFEEPSWELGVEYDISDTLFTYFKSRGSFRSGGFNGSAPPVNADATGGGNRFAEETVKDVEGGLKFQGSMLNRPASLNLAVYKQWVDDVQRIEFPDPPGPVASIAVTANVPEMVVKGVELEVSMAPTDWFEFGLAAAYTEADFTDGVVTLFGVQYSYSPVANTPEKTVALWGQLALPVPQDVGEVNLRMDAYWQDDMYFSNTAASITPDTELPSYELVNVRLNWNNMMGTQLSGALFSKNLLDEEHFVGGMPLGASLGHNAAAVGEPRTYGVELTYQF